MFFPFSHNLRGWHALTVMLEKHFVSAELSVPWLIGVCILHDSGSSYLMVSSRNWEKGSRECVSENHFSSDISQSHQNPWLWPAFACIQRWCCQAVPFLAGASIPAEHWLSISSPVWCSSCSITISAEIKDTASRVNGNRTLVMLLYEIRSNEITSLYYCSLFISLSLVPQRTVIMQTTCYKYLCKKTTSLLAKRSLNYNCLFTPGFPAAFMP